MSVDELRRAWYDEGLNPPYHRAKKEQLRHEWPFLYAAIQKLLKEKHESA